MRDNIQNIFDELYYKGGTIVLGKLYYYIP